VRLGTQRLEGLCQNPGHYRPEANPSGRKSRSTKAGVLGPIEGDKMSPAEYDAFLAATFANLTALMPQGGPLYVCGGTSTFSAYERAFLAGGIHLSSVIVWDKGSLTLTRKDYHSQYELVFYGWLQGKQHGFYGGRSQTDIWQARREQPGAYVHPTTKPVELVERALANSCQAGETVLDPFLGSGSTLIAAERSARRCLGVEIDPRWCEVVIQRYEAFSGEVAEKLA
jgi:DNA modification methylase